MKCLSLEAVNALLFPPHRSRNSVHSSKVVFLGQVTTTLRTPIQRKKGGEHIEVPHYFLLASRSSHFSFRDCGNQLRGRASADDNPVFDRAVATALIFIEANDCLGKRDPQF